MARLAILGLFIAMALAPASASAQAQPFMQWLEEFQREALSKGITRQTLDTAMEGIEPVERIIELDRAQPESTLTLEEYLESAVSEKRINEGRRNFAQNRDLLTKIGGEYGVQPKFIVALWGVETNYGQNTGGFDVIEALATLAYDGRRSEFFRDELLKALKIFQDENMLYGELQGSWAGALGQCQFMPSSFLQYAVDYDGDGKHDIWETPGDVFASIANYLKSSGWNGSEGWGFPVKLPAGFDVALADIKTEKPMSHWDRLGVRTSGGGKLPGSDAHVSLILVGTGEDAVPYIVYGNYKVLLKWNRSRFFATAVSMLADSIEQ